MKIIEQCQICKNNSIVNSIGVQNKDAQHKNCLVCGKYNITGTLVETLQYAERPDFLLSSYIRNNQYLLSYLYVFSSVSFSLNPKQCESWIAGDCNGYRYP